MAQDPTTRFNVQLDEEHAAKLIAIAERTYVQPGTIARSLLSTALDHADPDAVTITAVLDSISGALGRAQAGLAAAKAGQAIPLEEL